MGVAKKYDDDFAFEFSQMPHFACAIGQGKALGVVHTSDVAAVELRGGGALWFAGGQNQQGASAEHSDEGSF